MLIYWHFFTSRTCPSGWSLPYRLSRLEVCSEEKPLRRPGDKVDAQRVAQYAYGTATRRFRDQMRRWQPPREIIQKLAFLTGPPRYNLLALPVAEQETFISRSLQKTLKVTVQKSLTALKEDRTVDAAESN